MSLANLQPVTETSPATGLGHTLLSCMRGQIAGWHSGRQNAPQLLDAADRQMRRLVPNAGKVLWEGHSGGQPSVMEASGFLESWARGLTSRVLNTWIFALKMPNTSKNTAPAIAEIHILHAHVFISDAFPQLGRSPANANRS